jgi:excinuclease ABC subunit C
MPGGPGVYFFKDRRGKIVYVGKAKKLKSRIRYYLQDNNRLDPKTKALMETARSVDFIATETEVEALVLECNLIKEHRPRYNIRLKDDKRYPYLKLTLNEKFPRLLLVRNVKNDGAEYFGPYTDVGSVRRIMRLIKKIFPLRECNRAILPDNSSRECLNFQIGKCLGPCTGRVEKAEYNEITRLVSLFLKGQSSALVKQIERRMKEMSERKMYEEAAAIRDRIRSLSKIGEKQHAVDPGGGNEDIVAFAREGNVGCGIVMKVREGKILGSETFNMPLTVSDDTIDGYAALLKLYYNSATDIPPVIVIREQVPEMDLITGWLSCRRGKSVRMRIPVRGPKRRLLELAEKNAAMKLTSRTGSQAGVIPHLEELKKVLGLHVTPLLVEAYDISNIQGTGAVGSMVTFVRGKPWKTGYRHFRIKNIEGIDDVAMMREILLRRFANLKTGKSRKPDLIVVDGGIGQVNTALRAMGESGISGIPVIGLAKRREEIHLPTGGGTVNLPFHNPALKFLQRVRNEAHRFAVEYHRKLRRKGLTESALDSIEGIGHKRKILLLMKFGSYEGLKGASKEEIAGVPGIGPRLAERIYGHVNR